jgi:hypothetical protein
MVHSNEANDGKLTPQFYYEGTWTPIDASGAALPLSTATGYYTRIGRVVYWQAVIVYPETADVSTVKIAGLPYTNADDGSKGRAGAYISTTDSTATGVLRIGANLQFYAGLKTILTNANLSGKQFYLGGQFVTTAA